MNAISAIKSGIADLLHPFVDSRALVKSTDAASDQQTVDAMLKALDASSAKANDSSAASAVPNELGKDSFLQLLVLQMQNQDPLSPTDNTEMIAQLAQFSALEQMNNLNDKFEVLSGNIDQLNFISAGSMIGKTVTGIDTTGASIEGVIDGVQMQGSVVYLTVGEKLMSMAGVHTIK